MTWPRLLPRSLFGQIALLVAGALFVAQAINFALIFEGRRQVRLQAIVGPAVARVADAEDRIAAGRFRPGPRARIRLAPANPIAASTTRQADIERALATELAAAELPAGRIVTALHPLDPNDPGLGRRMVRRMRALPPGMRELVIAVERPGGGGWLVMRTPTLRGNGPLVGTLIVQTLILYLALLLPLLWITRHISRPLQSLARAAGDYRPGDAAPPLDEAGPNDVRAVIAAFKALRLRVAAMLDEKDRMLGAIGHDLRTPLAALRVRIESVDDETDRTKMAETIDEMSRTLDDILSFARLGRPSEPVTPVDIGALVEAVVEDFEALGASITLAPPARVTLSLRPVLMRRALRNLIENAVKYGGAAEVRIVARPAEVAICIADHGPGIPADQIEAVFDAFTRLETSRSRETGGAGLGLALARAIVREAGGDIALANRPEGGLEATILLPRG